MNTPQECDWLRSTHLKGVDVPPFEAFTLYGSNDSPSRLDLYTPRVPEYNTRPCAVVVPGDGDEPMNVTPDETKEKRER